MKKIVFVDNNPATLKNLKILFSTDLPYVFVPLLDSETTNIVEKLEAINPDLILIDLDMGPPDGVDFWKILNASGFRETPKLIVTRLAEGRTYRGSPYDPDEITYISKDEFLGDKEKIKAVVETLTA